MPLPTVFTSNPYLELFWNSCPIGLAWVEGSGALRAENPALLKLLKESQKLNFLDLDHNAFTGPLSSLAQRPLLLEGQPPVPVKVSSCSLGEGFLLFIEERFLEVQNQKLSNEIAASEHIRLKAGSLAHDFNNLLTAILGNISLAMVQAPQEGKLHEMLNVVHDAGMRAQDMAKQLLTLSKESSETKKDLDLAALLRECVQLLQRGSPCTFDFQLQEPLWPVYANIGQMSQVFNNLIINAVQASSKGKKITLRARNQEEDGMSRVHIEIQDEGAGIAPENLQKLFTPYFTTKKTGNGLGLPSVQAILHEHKGTIRVSSTVGVGTTMTVTLPALPQKIQKTHAQTPEKPSLANSGKGRILLMDDERVIQQIGSEMLQYLGYATTLASNGTEALALYKKALHTPDAFAAVILDLAIPGDRGGREIIQELRALDPDAIVLVSSGYSEDPSVKEFQKHGFSGVLSKPYNLNSLAEAVQLGLRRVRLG